eukprot:6458999-Amphidinium_carterae.1
MMMDVSCVRWAALMELLAERERSPQSGSHLFDAGTHPHVQKTQEDSSYGAYTPTRFLIKPPDVECISAPVVLIWRGNLSCRRWMRGFTLCS